MAHILKTIGKVANVPFKHFECDNTSDLSAIDTSNVLMGSTCYVINTGTWYHLNSQGQWKIYTANSGGGGGGGTDTPSVDDNYIYDGGEEA